MVVVLGVIAALWWSWRTEPDDSLSELASLVCSSREEELPGKLESKIARRAAVEQIDPSLVMRGREEIIESAQKLRRNFPRCSVELQLSSTGVDEREAWAEGEVEYSASQAFDLHARRRPFRVRLRKRGDSLLLTYLWIGPRRHSVPEARP